MKRLFVQIAMLSMALLLLSACASSGYARSLPTPEILHARVAGSAAVTAMPSPQSTLPGTSSGAEEAGAAIPAVSKGHAAATATPTLSKTGQAAPAPSAEAKPEAASTPASQHNTADAGAITFAVIGDGGSRSRAEQQVAEMVNGWKPDFILSTGDGYYGSAGGNATGKYDRSVGAYYCNFLKDISTTGTDCLQGKADRNEFFPTLGNHDYSDASIENYLKYFSLPGSDFTNTSGNERYYDFTWGPAHFFSLNSNSVEPDGVTADSKQAQWLKTQLSKSTSAWNIVYFHHPPYTSGIVHGPDKTMRWPFGDWGVQAVFSGHEHLYERLLEGGVAYFVNGLGGGARYAFGPQPAEGSQARVSGTWGAQKVTATDKMITFDFYTVDGKLADSYTMTK